MTFMHRLRLRALALIVGIGLTTLALISLTTMPAWPIVGVAVATLAVCVHSLAHRVNPSTCLGCGQSVADEPAGEHGRVCRACGTIAQPMPGHFASDLPLEGGRWPEHEA
ncbi:MAG: hypothetical protein IPM33_10240 [Phycisphaerales bacterium]|nr:hypothetical protein [Phycisphaerales bacterium]